MRSTALLACLLLTAGAALALPARPKAPQSPASEIFALPLPSQQQSDGRALHYRLDSAGRELAFDVRVNGQPYLDEKLTLPADAAGATFELLAGDTVHRDRLFKLAENWRNRVRVTVKVDGRAVRELSFQELVASSRDLQRLPSRPGKVTNGVRWFSAEAEGAPSGNPLSGLLKDCTSSCQSDFYSCMSSSCPGQEECDYCNNEFATCNNNCSPPPSCTDPKSVSNSNTSTLVGATWEGEYCLNDYPSGQLYDHYYLVYRHDYYTTTTYCDGSSSVTSYSTYTSSYCDEPTYISCSYPGGYPSCY
jgi:hypothetical protein